MHAQQAEFSPILFDMLFGLLIFLAFGALLDLHGTAHFVFYLASIGVVVHWWLKHKAAQELYGHEAANSTLDLLFGIAKIALLQVAMLAAAHEEYVVAVTYFAMPLLIESVWALFRRFFGTWHRSTAKRVRYMEQQLEYVLFLNLGTAVILGFIVALSPTIAAPDLVMCFILTYFIYAFFAHRYEITDVRLT